MSNWSQLKLIAVAAAVGAAAVAAAVSAVLVVDEYFYGNRRKRKNVKKNVPGLYNLGNTCFANALLQSLAACPSFEIWLWKVKEVIPKDSVWLLRELGDVIESLNNSSDDAPASADGVLLALRSHRWNITPDIEQDLFELFNVFVTTWDEELAPFCNGKAFTLADVRYLDEASWKDDNVDRLRSVSEIVRAHNQYRSPCSGLLGTELACHNCGIKNVRHDRFCSLDLTLPKTTYFPEITIEACLRKYFAHEVLVNYKCERCHLKDDASTPLRKRPMVKKQGISKLPECLILRIQRVGILPNGTPFKHMDHVKFSETLCLCDYLFYQDKKSIEKMRSIGSIGDCAVKGGDSAKSMPLSNGPSDDGMSTNSIENLSRIESLVKIKNRSVYNLRAVVVHIGQPDSGHFVTYRRGWSPESNGQQSKGQWFYTSDTEVKRVPFETAATREAYMLFYERQH